MYVNIVDSVGPRPKVKHPPMAPSPLGEVVAVPLSSVKPYPDNPRKVPQKAVEQCAASIREFGWQQPLVVDRDMVIIAGHTRYAAAKYLREQEVPVVIAGDLTPEQVRAFRIVDNRTHDYSSWDYPLLMGELEGLDDAFAEVLDLADWGSIIQQYDTAKAEAELSFSPEVAASIAAEFRMTVTFASQEEADKAAPDILDIPGVVDVAYSRR
jgi:ParB-like nuclease domain